ncbi:MAG: class I SAM-dependent methyltransferase [Bacteroidetes bacterium]|nr:class I SAM-dependent methyltransferase [Bacteroidota bacterium]
MKSGNFFFEFEDLSWFPHTIRESMTDYLRYLLTTLDLYKPVIPLIADGLNKSKTNKILDLCSGGGGPIEQLLPPLQNHLGLNIEITLTDKYPNISAYEMLALKLNASVSFSHESVDAAHVPSNLSGFRTLFSGFHHFNKKYAQSIIQNAVNAKSGIGIFDGGDKNIFTVLGIILLHPIAFFLFTPFFKPFRFSRIFFTYLIPIIPLCTIWDGVVSIIRLHNPGQLIEMAEEVDRVNYSWKAGTVKNKFGMRIAYLIGTPLADTSIENGKV